MKAFAMGSHSFWLSPVAQALYCWLKWLPVSVTVPSEMCSYLLAVGLSLQVCPSTVILVSENLLNTVQ